MDVFPDVIRIEAVGQCNFRCIHCPTGTEPNNRKALSEEKFSVILEQFQKNNYVPRVAVLYHGGEPLLNKNLATYIRALKKMGVSKTVITTNASLLDEFRAQELIRAGLDEIKISFDGESPEENNSIRRNGDFRKNAENVRRFCALLREMGREDMNVIISNVRICKLATIEKFIKEKQTSFAEPPQYLKDFFSDEAGVVKFQSFPAMIWPGYERYSSLKAAEFDRKQLSYCGPLFETYTIMANGDVVACCYDLNGEVVFGNVFEVDMFEIWNGEKYRKFRNDFRQQRYSSLCLKCNLVVPRFLYRND